MDSSDSAVTANRMSDSECTSTGVDGGCPGGGEWAGMTVIKLRFEPHWKGHRDGFYFQKQQNRCVCCARTNSLVKFQIVPHGFKRFFPAKIKSNSANNTQGKQNGEGFRTDAVSNRSLILIRIHLPRHVWPDVVLLCQECSLRGNRMHADHAQHLFHSVGITKPTITPRKSRVRRQATKLRGVLRLLLDELWERKAATARWV